MSDQVREIDHAEPVLKCSFCGQKNRRLIAGPRVFICNECIELCYEMTNHWGAEDALAVTERRNAERAAAVVDTGEAQNERPKSA